MFELADRGFDSGFQQLVGCILSIRTRDEVSLPAALRLLERGAKPAAVARLSESQIDELIGSVAFHRPRRRRFPRSPGAWLGSSMGSCPVITRADLVPGRRSEMREPYARHCRRQFRISADVHVHRVTNRWGYSRAPTSERTLAALEAKLPRSHWIELNALLVPFGKTHLHRPAAQMLHQPRARVL